MQALGMLGGPGANANGINDSGQVVGSSRQVDDSVRAFLWQDGMMRDLNALIDPGSGWHLWSARAINNCGQIVGEDYYLGWQSKAFLLTPDQDATTP